MNSDERFKATDEWLAKHAHRPGSVGVNQRVIATTSFHAVATPRPGIGINEARDKWLEAGNAKVLDDGGRNDPRLLVAAEQTHTVIYELVPELSPPGFTVENAIAHMRSIGMDVRGEGPRSAKGHPTIIVSEKING